MRLSSYLPLTGVNACTIARSTLYTNKAPCMLFLEARHLKKTVFDDRFKYGLGNLGFYKPQYLKAWLTHFSNP